MPILVAAEEARQRVQQLVAKYEALSARAIKGYNEANTKDGFVRPLFEALGWDFSNLDEVEGEKTITPGRVDYLFKVNGVSKFCLEVKALHVDINDERWIRQAITYAYYKGVTWAVLTNFKALRAFNAERETRDIRQIAFLSLTCEDYLTGFHRLWLLSREAVDSGDLDREAVAYGRLPPRLPVEKRLYDKLTAWREALFNEVYLHYKDEGLIWSQMDQRIQQLLNRLIFIRTTEDRGLIDRTLLAALHQWRGSSEKGDLMDRLRDIFHEFANLYDSDLFPQIMDPWDSISIKNSWVLADIIQGLYEVPGGLADWDFATIGSDVLGTVYEQYLGYVPAQVKKEAKEAQQRLFPTEPHIGITAKREKRKGEGIYYTPTWVVDYIVKQTIGRFIEEHSYDDILNIKILDPACGSGSFLTRAYEELLYYHARQQGKSPADLDQSERTRILLRNIYGVDLDQQAIEIARLSLLLCSLSGQETLPSLANNIRRGNSLISGTEEELRRYFGDGWREKKPFNWDEEFPQIMKDGGFDVVIGNPPYVRPHKLEASEKQALWAQYQVYRAKSDIYACFIQRAIDLLKPGGCASYIVSNTFMSLESFAPLRRYILDTCCILYFGLTPKKVFGAATVETIVLGLKKETNEDARRQNKVLIAEYRDGTFVKVKEICQGIFYSTYLNIFDLSRDETTPPLSSKIELNTDKVSECVDFCYGLKTGDDTIFLTYEAVTPEHKKLLRRSDFGRYSIEYKGEFVWYVPEQMRKHRTTARPGNRDRFEKPKILVQDIGKCLIGTLDDEHFYVKDALILHEKEKGFQLEFLLALINSKLLNFWYGQKFSTLSVAKNAILTLPIRRIDFENPAEKKMHDKLVSLVERMLELNKRLAPIRNTPCNERDELRREIERTDRQIDNLVYDLYGLTEEERNRIKSETAPD